MPVHVLDRLARGRAVVDANVEAVGLMLRSLSLVLGTKQRVARRDFGVGLQGSFNQSQSLRYSYQFGNDSSTNAEIDKNKANRISVGYAKPTGFAVEGFYGHFARDGDTDRSIYQIFACYRQPRVRGAFQYYRNSRNGADGNDLEAITQATDKALAVPDRPSLVIVRTEIGYASPKQGTFGVHGSPLDAEQVKETKRKLGYPSEEPFFLAEDAVKHLREAVERGRAAETAWKGRFDAYRKAHPELAAELERRIAGELPKGWDQDIPTFTTGDKPIATRAADRKSVV